MGGGTSPLSFPGSGCEVLIDLQSWIQTLQPAVCAFWGREQGGSAVLSAFGSVGLPSQPLCVGNAGKDRSSVCQSALYVGDRGIYGPPQWRLH